MNQKAAQLRGRQWSGSKPANEEEARARVIEAFIRIVERQGYERVSMAGVAREAGITRPTLYKYFNSITDLYFASVRSVFEEKARALATRLKTRKKLESQLLESLRSLNRDSSEDKLYSTFLRTSISSDLVQGLSPADREEAQVSLLSIALEPIFDSHPSLDKNREEFMSLFTRLAISLLFAPFPDDASIKRFVKMLLDGIK